MPGFRVDRVCVIWVCNWLNIRMLRTGHPRTRCFFEGSAEGCFAKGFVSMIYNVDGAEPTIQNVGLARGVL